MALNKESTRTIIRDCITRLGLHSEVAVELLMGTCAVESNFGTYNKQLGDGPALGVFQMEPATMRDIWDNYINYRAELKRLLASEFGMIRADECRLQYDIEYSIVMARLKYRRSKYLLPYNSTDIEGLAEAWKRDYNTYLGKGKTSEFISKYKKYCI